MRSLFLSFASLIVVTNALAQVNFGPEIGVNTCGYSSHYGRQVTAGARAGGKVDIGLTGHLQLQSGILYVNNGLGSTHLAGGSYPTMSISTVEVPVNIVYKAQGGGVSSPFIGIGPYIGINTGGRITISPGDLPSPQPTIIRSLKIGSSAGDDIKMLDAGLSVTAGVQLANGLYIRILFQKGFMNLQPQGDADNYLRRFNLGLSIGYLFHCKHIAQPTEKK